MIFDTVRWTNRELVIIDQTLLPTEYKEIVLRTARETWDAIKVLKVRGAPAIGVCAGYGVLVGMREKAPASAQAAVAAAVETADYLATSRPTAVNLFYALDRMKAVAATCGTMDSADAVFDRLEAEANAIYDEDVAMCRAIGGYGAALVNDGDGILTHCNAGGLATSGYGTALAVMFSAKEAGRRFHVFADETRPLLQGARLTSWELMRAGIDVTLICDNMAAQVMREGRIQLVVVGADRIAANGDAANKIGTYGVALLAKAHGIPFYVAAPFSTFDLTIASGVEIPIEQRDPDEITCAFGKRTAPEGVKVYNPAFDVTPAELIAGIITERGILRAPFNASIAAAQASA